MRKKSKNRKAEMEASSSSNGFSSRGMTETASSLKDEAEQTYADLRES